MNGNEIIALARKTYVEQFVAFVRQQHGKLGGGAPEAMIEIPGVANLFGGQSRADYFFKTGDDQVVLAFEPDGYVTFDPIEGMAGATRFRLEKLVWDDIEFVHDAPMDLTLALTAWFERWYDPDDRRAGASPGQPPDVIHSLGVAPGRLHVDFGTASVDAFWAMVMLLRDAGARRVTVTDTRSRYPRPTPSTG